MRYTEAQRVLDLVAQHGFLLAHKGEQMLSSIRTADDSAEWYERGTAMFCHLINGYLITLCYRRDPEVMLFTMDWRATDPRAN
jgi:hypothetical protein